MCGMKLPIPTHTIPILEWITTFVPHLDENVIIRPYGDKSSNILIKTVSDGL